MPNVSIVIPAHNAMPYLPMALESVLGQTFTDYEVLIINDGSTDHIEQWVEQVTDPRVKLISQDKLGVSAARNTGITAAQGEYIAFLDADDLWEPTKLETQVQVLNKQPQVGLVYSWILLTDEQNISSGRTITSDIEGEVLSEVIEHNPIQTSTVVVRRSCLETVGTFNPNLHSAEDWELWVRIAARYHLAVIKQPLVRYRQHSSSATSNWQATEQALAPTINQVFGSVPLELQYLKHRCYGHGNLHLAWKALQSGSQGYLRAWYFCQRAIKHYPQLCFSRQYLRLSLAILMTRCFGANGFSKAKSWVYALRRYLSSSAA